MSITASTVHRICRRDPRRCLPWGTRPDRNSRDGGIPDRGRRGARHKKSRRSAIRMRISGPVFGWLWRRLVTHSRPDLLEEDHPRCRCFGRMPSLPAYCEVKPLRRTITADKYPSIIIHRRADKRTPSARSCPTTPTRLREGRPCAQPILTRDGTLERSSHRSSMRRRSSG